MLRAARYLLARHAHADITLKAVADRAGVSAPLILKYFGNKDTLFSQVMSFETDAAALLDAPLADLGRHMVRQVLMSQTEQGADPLLRIVFAPLHGEQGDILRGNFRTQVSDRLAARRNASSSAALKWPRRVRIATPDGPTATKGAAIVRNDSPRIDVLPPQRSIGNRKNGTGGH
ncbi:helix-turn-helix domain-containing protein [Streptomyces sp. NPDC055722]